MCLYVGDKVRHILMPLNEDDIQSYAYWIVIILLVCLYTDVYIHLFARVQVDILYILRFYIATVCN